MSTQPTAARAVSAGISNFRILISSPPAYGTVPPREFLRGPGIISVGGPGKKLRFSGFQNMDFAVSLDDLADGDGLFPRLLQGFQDGRRRPRRDYHHHPDAHVEDAVHLVAGDVARLLQELEDRRGLPRAPPGPPPHALREL